MSGRALGWAKEQRAPSREAKAALVFLADYASAAGFAWPSIATLAAEIGCSDRTVIRKLKDLVEASLLVRLEVEDRMTGRTRPCSYWFPMAGRGPTAAEVAAFEAEVGGRVTLVSPWEGATGDTLEGDTADRGRVTTVSPLDPPLEPSEPEGSSPGAREAGLPAGLDAGLVAEIEAAAPRTMIAVSSRPAYREALEVLAAEGCDLAVLPGALRRLSADRLFTGLRVPPRLEAWLLDGKWRAYLPEGGGAGPAAEGPVCAADDGATAAWVKTMAAMQTLMGPGEFGSWLSRASLGQIGERLYVVAWSGPAVEHLRRHRWEALVGAWRAAGDRRELTLVDRRGFEALMRQEGVG